LNAAFMRLLNGESSTDVLRILVMEAEAADAGRVDPDSELESLPDCVAVESIPALGTDVVAIGLVFEAIVERLSRRTELAQFAPAGNPEPSIELSVGLVGAVSCVAAATGCVC